MCAAGHLFLLCIDELWVSVLRVLGDRHQPTSCPVRHDPLLLDARALKCKSWGSDWNECDKIVERESSVSASL